MTTELDFSKLSSEQDKKFIENLDSLYQKGIYSKDEVDIKKKNYHDKRMKDLASGNTKKSANTYMERVENNDPSCVELDLNSKALGNQAVVDLFKALQTNTYVKKLTLQRNCFTDQCVPTICQTIRVNQTLEVFVFIYSLF